MSELLSMLVPLETLPGWPAAPNPPVLTSLGLLIGLPLLAALVIIGISQLSALAKRGRGETGSLDDSGWVGAQPSELGSGQGRGELEVGTGQKKSAEQTGGVGGRW